MIAFIDGEVITAEPTLTVILSQEIGFELKISLHTYSELKIGERVRLYTQLVIRENDVHLYGFWNYTEKQLFNSLLTVSGVGGNTALTMLSKLPVSELSTAISQGNVSVLKSIKGIGEKTAARIILELQGKLILPATQTQTTHKQQSIDIISAKSVRLDSILALVNLGFPRNSTEKLVDQVLAKNPQFAVDEVIKSALQNR
ncbi:MAG: Holliday junction branch migration protein RuvA [Bacteroidia bacterium]|nr:Holliday junction branch migration protein RuvA [Bacteroidia bacterium]